MLMARPCRATSKALRSYDENRYIDQAYRKHQLRDHNGNDEAALD
jgi:hypothetical protein